MFELTTNLEIFYKCSARFFLILNKNAIGKIAIKENDENVIFVRNDKVYLIHKKDLSRIPLNKKHLFTVSV